MSKDAWEELLSNRKLTGKHLLFACVVMPMCYSLGLTVASADICVSILDDTGVLCYQPPSGYGHKIELDHGGLNTGAINSWLRYVHDRSDGQLTPLNINEEEFNCKIEQALEEMRDAAVQKAAAEILKLDPNKEYAVLFFDVDGKIVVSAILDGDFNSVPISKIRNALNNTPGSGGIANLVGFMHSHPPVTPQTLYQGAVERGESPPLCANPASPVCQENVRFNNQRNRAPSLNDFGFVGEATYSSLGSVARRTLSRDDFKDWQEAFSQYIIGPDGVVREFDGIDTPDYLLDKERDFTDGEAAPTEDDAKGEGC